MTLLPAVLLVLCSIVLWPAAVRSQGNDWTIPADAASLTSPAAATPDTLKKAAGLYKSNCEKCHGAQGKGDGRYADPKHPPANLTDSSAADNPDGVLFYKIWNGKKPMPAFKTLMTTDEVWSVVAYVKSLRKT